MPSTANGRPLLSATVTMPLVGAWHAEIEVDGTRALEGPVKLVVNGQEFLGATVRSAPFAGRVRARVVGGGGGLSRDLEPRNYTAGPTVRAILEDILGDSDRLSPQSDPGALATTLPRWHRLAGVASHAIVALLEEVNATWRVLADGTVWVGQETWPEISPQHDLIDEDWHAGIITIAPRAPSLRPGVTFRGHRIEQVVHVFGQQLRTEAYLSSAQSALSRFLGPIKRAIDYSRKWPARVSGVNGDGTIQVVPDDARIRGAGLDRVAIRTGFPGRITPQNGTRCLIGWEGGDPSRPYAEGWDTNSVLEMSLAGGTLPNARQGDMTLNGGPFTQVQFWAAPSATGTPVPMSTETPYYLVFSQTGVPALVPPPLSPYLSGTVSSGRQNVKS
jgi:hypothetical protein